MSDSPFASFRNSTLRFLVAGAGPLQPDSRGNMRPTDAVLEVAAMLDAATDQGQSGLKEADLPGVDVSSVYLEGYAIEPMLLPSVVGYKSVAEANWDGRTGRFILGLVTNSPYGDTALTGHEIRGYFQAAAFSASGEPWSPTPTPEPVSSLSLTRELLAINTPAQTAFTLMQVPASPQLSELYLNGVKASYGDEYSLNSSILNWLGVSLATTDELEILYYVEPA